MTLEQFLDGLTGYETSWSEPTEDMGGRMHSDAEFGDKNIHVSADQITSPTSHYAMTYYRVTRKLHAAVDLLSDWREVEFQVGQDDEGTGETNIKLDVRWFESFAAWLADQTGFEFKPESRYYSEGANRS